jgi:hypothetical protein
VLVLFNVIDASVTVVLAEWVVLVKCLDETSVEVYFATEVTAGA